ncbi:MAG: polysaccharide deacetylase family protein [Chloroflexi bacterium]|nr:polysaccharide deacetylase family protein [Chloroflexota bacterium]
MSEDASRLGLERTGDADGAASPDWLRRDFVGYGKAGFKAEWPGGARIAINVVINYEEGSERNPLEGDPIRETAAEYPHVPVPPAERERSNETIYEYGSRVGVWRILRLLEKYDVQGTCFASAVALERNLEAAREFTRLGHDMVGHGYRWEYQHDQNPETERQRIRLARDSILATTGQRIEGWFARYVGSNVTRSILQSEGFLYDATDYSDDLPFFQQVNGQRFLVVPYTIDNNDIRFWRGTLHTGDQFFGYLRDCFDCLYDEGATRPQLMTVGLHCRVIGKPSRAPALERFLQYARRHPKVWFAGRNAIARHWLEKYG